MHTGEVRWRPSAPLEILRTRAQMLGAARDWFARSGALEVETPTLSAAAVTDVHLASIEATVCGRRRYLHTSPEFAMKRLLAAGYGDLWQIARVYRDGEVGPNHNPEFTMIEWYRTGIDHHALMREVDAMIATMLNGRRALGTGESLSYRDAFLAHLGADPFRASIAELAAALAQCGVALPAGLGEDRDAWLDLAMAVVVGPQLGRDRLTFVYDYPASQAALARRRGEVASRFEVYLDGLELANGFHELSDEVEQRHRIAADLDERRQRGLPPMPVDEHLLAALAHGLPECAGVALGFDRLVMCAVGARRIDEVIAFPFERA
jgi:lysyl-tRNA synthetase class 2